MARQDYLNTDDGDLLFENGDLVVGDSDEQHVQDICKANKGAYREHVLLGVDAIRYVNSSGKRRQFTRVVKEELKKDGYSGLKIRFANDRLDYFTIQD